MIHVVVELNSVGNRKVARIASMKSYGNCKRCLLHRHPTAMRKEKKQYSKNNMVAAATYHHGYVFSFMRQSPQSPSSSYLLQLGLMT